MSKYDDIIDHPHFQSATRPHMSMHDRAAQFAPFAALVGYDAAVEETARLTDEKIVLDEDVWKGINQTINELNPGDLVNITYFLPDAFKSGGMYIHTCGTLKKTDPVEKIIMLTDGTNIPIADIFSIEKRQ